MTKCQDGLIIVIGRSFGSGGREIGRKVAAELGIPFYDKELLEIAARDGRICIEDLKMLDEQKTSGMLYSMALNPYTRNITIPWDVVAEGIQRDAIKAVAKQGPCVIVGRRADKILAEDYDVFSVFISAPLEKRIERVAKRDALPEKDSKKKIIKADKSRRYYYNSYGGGDWGEAETYNLCLNSGDLGIDNAAEMILHCLKITGKLA